MSLELELKTIPHTKQRYDTCGDYTQSPDGKIHFRVSELANWRKEACVFIHEFVEKMLCRSAGISDKEIDDFDIGYKGDSEPGNDAFAPYHNQHVIAEQFERLLASQLGIDWNEYCDQIDAL